MPADGKLVHGEVFANQASMTGENDPVKKMIAPNNYEPEDNKNLSDPYLLFRQEYTPERAESRENVSINMGFFVIHIQGCSDRRRRRCNVGGKSRC